MGYHVFVDNSNVWIEGMYNSAVCKKWVPNILEAHNTKKSDRSWRIDFGRLLEFVVNGEMNQIKTAMLFGSRPPYKDSLWDKVREAGFEVTLMDRNVVNKEKAVDTLMVHSIAECLYCKAVADDVFVLVAGDKDFIPSMQGIHKKNMSVVVAFWDNVSAELKAEADTYLNLSINIGNIEY